VSGRAHEAGRVLRLVVLGAASGVLAGLASFAFLEALDRATTQRLAHPSLVWLLPLAGLAIGAMYHHLGGHARRGSALLLDEIHTPTTWVPRRMAPLVFAGTVAGHVFGASVGREGAALQISGSLTDLMSRTLRLDSTERRLLLVAALAGGFGAVFGVPLAGAVFALEVQSVGRVRYDALVPALTASVVGDLVVRGLGHAHVARPQLVMSLGAGLLARVALAGAAFGVVAMIFVAATHLVARAADRIAYPPARLVAGGTALVGLAVIFGRQYLGLSLPLADHALAGHAAEPWVFALKLLFTAVALGSGFPGGEVTPLFVIGATLGSAMATVLGVDVTLLGALGFVAVFGAAANTPLACTIMAAELFGSNAAVVAAVACVVAYLCSGHAGIYPSQRVDTPKRGLPQSPS